MMIRATYEHGILKPFQPLNLVEGQTVRISIMTDIPFDPNAFARIIPMKMSPEEAASRMTKIAESSAAEGLHDSNVSTDHDRYLYGDKSEFSSTINNAQSGEVSS